MLVIPDPNVKPNTIRGGPTTNGHKDCGVTSQHLREQSGRLQKAHNTFRHWLGENYDIDALDAVLTTAAVEKLEGDPLWLLVLSGASTAKTETVLPLSDCEGAQTVSTFTTDAGLLSGSSQNETSDDATGGLLRLLEPRGIMLIKDVTSILNLGPTPRGLILAAFREIFDGRWSRHTGTDGGKTLEWQGRIAVIGAVTAAWDRHYAAISQMGDRFVLLRIDSTKHRIEHGTQSVENTAHETEMRGELRSRCADLIGAIDPKSAPVITEAEKQRIVAVANLVTHARTAVEFDRYRHEVIDVDDLEGPARFAKQLTQIIRGATVIGLTRNGALRLAIRCARDSMPPLRLACLEYLNEHGGSNIADISRGLGKQRTMVKRALESLVALDLLNFDDTTATKFGVTQSMYSLVSGTDVEALGLPERDSLCSKWGVVSSKYIASQAAQTFEDLQNQRK